MQFEILQESQDKRDILTMFTAFVDKKKIKTQEQLDQRFDCLAVEFCQENNGIFSTSKPTMNFTKLKTLEIHWK